MVTAELAGTFEAPLYGMLAVQRAIDKADWTGLPEAGDPLQRPAGRSLEARPSCGKANGK